MSVSMFDATSIFQGEKVNTYFDFVNVADVCPIMTEDIQQGDLVAVIHSISRGLVNNVWTMQFGIYGVVLLAKRVN